jgi:hypothetical protein
MASPVAWQALAMVWQPVARPGVQTFRATRGSAHEVVCISRRCEETGRGGRLLLAIIAAAQQPGRLGNDADITASRAQS